MHIVRFWKNYFSASEYLRTLIKARRRRNVHLLMNKNTFAIYVAPILLIEHVSQCLICVVSDTDTITTLAITLNYFIFSKFYQYQRVYVVSSICVMLDTCNRWIGMVTTDPPTNIIAAWSTSCLILELLAWLDSNEGLWV